jgi:GTP cyclohydrolase I
MEDLYRQLLVSIGEDPDREGLADTPARAAKAMRFLTKGYNETAQEVVGNAIFNTDTSELVIVKGIELYSLCEHHLLPFVGTCHVGYIPRGKVVGLSKIARIVDVFARRLQIQEMLTAQIANGLQKVIDASGVAVVIEAKHMCMMMRGVEKQNSVMTTSCMLGEFQSCAQARGEFLSHISH